MTDKEIRVEPRLSNLKLLAYHHKNFDSDGSEISEWLDQFSMLPAKTIAGAEVVLGNKGKVYRLIASGYLRCDLSKPITPESTITLSKKGEPNVEIFI